MEKQIKLDHGSGGMASRRLVESLFLKYLKSPVLAGMQDSAVIGSVDGRMAFSTDSYVVDPIFFPGGSIGDLAVNGTVNDLAMSGAAPVCLSLSFILEEGFQLAQLEAILQDIARACGHAGLDIVTGDTKVVPRGKADKIFVNTSGIGQIPEGINISPSRIRQGDAILVSGSIANHGATILAERLGLDSNDVLTSDTCPLNHLAAAILETAPDAVHAMRDPTRGGLATALWELAESSGCCFEIEEEAIPVEPPVRAVCELTGIDPLYLANEGRCIVIAAREQASTIRELMRSVEQGSGATVIGRVTGNRAANVILSTRSGGSRLIEPLSGEPLPRIC